MFLAGKLKKTIYFVIEKEKEKSALQEKKTENKWKKRQQIVGKNNRNSPILSEPLKLIPKISELERKPEILGLERSNHFLQLISTFPSDS